MEKLVEIVKEKNINTLVKFMNDLDIMRIIENWHLLAEDECGEKIDYEKYIVKCYQEVLENV